MRKLCSFLLLMFVVLAAHAQIQDPVKFKTELKALSDTEGEIIFTAAIDPGWHVYSTNLGDGGPISATFNVDKKNGLELVGKLKPVGNEISTFDKLFQMKVRYFESTAQFVQKIKFIAGTYTIEGYLEYGACDDESCLPPTQVPFNLSGKTTLKATEPVAESKVELQKEAEVEPETVATSADTAAVVKPVVSADILWKPVIDDLQAYGEEHSQEDMSWIYIFITGFLGGLNIGS